MTKFEKVYRKLLKAYGPQGWWPILDHNGSNPTKTGVLQGYHPGDYSFPKNRSQRFEICCGAILVQHTSWTSVEKALANLKQKGLIDASLILRTTVSTLARMIKPAGFPKQKAKTLIGFARFFNDLGRAIPKRTELMGLMGIGNETADLMLCYAWSKTNFVVDTYKKRIFKDLRLINPNSSYEKIQIVFTTNILNDIKVYQEYHALVVEHAKRIRAGGAIKLSV